MSKIKRYCRDNLGASYLIGFQIFLLLVAILLIAGNSALANEVAIYAYLLLLIGIVLQLISFSAFGKKKANTTIDEETPSEAGVKEC